MSKKIFLPTVVIGGTLFAFFCLFLVTQGSKNIEIEVENQKFFDGKLKDVISPSIGALFCMGLGVSTGGVLGWGQSLRKNFKMEQQISNLQQLISQKESEIEDLRFSGPNLKRAQLDLFLEDAQKQDTLEDTSPLIDQEELETVTNNNFVVLNTTSTMPAAQSVISLAHKQPRKANPVETNYKALQR